MKKVALLALICWLATFYSHAQPDIITLNDATASIDAVITLPPDTTGTIVLNLALASVRLLDDVGNTVFSVADSRLHALEINLMANSGTHTLHIERLPGVLEALVSVDSTAGLRFLGTSQPITGDILALNQEVAVTLDSTLLGTNKTFTIPLETVGVITASFPQVPARVQLVDSMGKVVIDSQAGHIDALNAVLEGDTYQMTVLATSLSLSHPVGFRSMSATEGGFTNLLEAPISSTTAITATSTPTIATRACQVTVLVPSVNLRSGPGTGYSILEYGYVGDTYLVGGRNPENNWLLIGTSSGGSAWISADMVQQNADCDSLTVFNIPLKDAPAAQIVITNGSTGAQIPYYGDDDDHEDHEDDDEHDDDEHDDD